MNVAVHGCLLGGAVGDDFARGVTLAVGHSGDGDSTGSITGQMLGARLGIDAVPARWLDGLALRDVIEAVADDVAVGWQDGESWWRKYPGW